MSERVLLHSYASKPAQGRLSLLRIAVQSATSRPGLVSSTLHQPESLLLCLAAREPLCAEDELCFLLPMRQRKCEQC